MLAQRLKEILDRKDLLFQFFVRDLKVKYKNSVLGIFWSLLSPILIVSIYTIVFSVIMRFKTEYPYPLFLLAVWLPWQFMQTSLMMSSSILLEHGDLLNKIYFPRIYLPLSNLMTHLVNYFISLILFFIVRAFYMDGYSAVIVFFPLVILIHVIFTFGLCLFISAGTVFFRDLRYLLDVFMLLWFFGSPIIYGIEFVPDWFLWIYFLNPFTGIAMLYRHVLLGSGVDAMLVWALMVSAVWAAGVLILGIRFFYRFENAVIKEL